MTDADQAGRPMRVPSEEIVQAAKLLPNGGSIAVIDGDFAPDEFVPGNAVRGAWIVLAGGTLSGVFDVNPGFDPNHVRPKAESKSGDTEPPSS